MELPRRSSLSLLRILPRKLRGLVASRFALAPKAAVSQTDDEDEDDDEDDEEEDEENPPLSGIKLARPGPLMPAHLISFRWEGGVGEGDLFQKDSLPPHLLFSLFPLLLFPFPTTPPSSRRRRRGFGR